MSEIRTIAHNTIYQTIGKVISLGVALIAFGVMTRYLGAQGFGNYTTIFGFLTVFGILLDLGLQMTTTQLIANPANDESRIISNALTLRLLTAVLFIGLVCGLVLFFPYSALVKIGIVIASVGFILNSLVTTLTSFFQKRLIIHELVAVEIIAKLAYLISIIIAVQLDYGLLGIVSAVIIDNAILLAGLLFFTKRKIAVRFATDWETWTLIIKTTWPIALTIALNLIYFKGDILIMSLVRSQAEVGIYGAPYRVLEVLINIIYLFLGLLLPIFAAAASIKNYDKIKNTLQGSFDFLMMVVVPMIIGGLFVGRPLMTLIAGTDFVVSGDLIKVLLIATGSIFIAGLFGYAIVALGEQKRMIKFYAINAILSVIGYVIFIPRYGYWGAAWMTVASELLILITAAWVIKKTLGFTPSLNRTLRVGAASGVMALALYFLPTQNVFLLIGVGMATYTIALFAFRGVDRALVTEILSLRTS